MYGSSSSHNIQTTSTSDSASELHKLCETLLNDLSKRRAHEPIDHTFVQNLRTRDRSMLIDDYVEVVSLLRQREAELSRVCNAGLQYMRGDSPHALLAQQIQSMRMLFEMTRRDVVREVETSDSIVRTLMADVARREREVTERENRVWGWRMVAIQGVANMKGDVEALEQKEDALRQREEAVLERERAAAGKEEYVRVLEEQLRQRERDVEERLQPYMAPTEVHELRQSLEFQSSRLREEVGRVQRSVASASKESPGPRQTVVLIDPASATKN